MKKQQSPGSVTASSHAGNGSGVAHSAPLLPTATSAQRVPRNAPLDHIGLYFNRELSWLDFNWRVLYLAVDERLPLLERVRFLAIVSSNLDEFFRKRVGGLKRQAAAGVRRLSPDGRTPEQQLKLICSAIPRMYREMGTIWQRTLKPLLAENAGIHVLNYNDCTARQRERLDAHFRTNIYPILTPLAVDPGHPFPFISNLSLSLAVMLRHPQRGGEHFARLKVPKSRQRWVALDEPNHFVPVEQVIEHNVESLFRGMELLHVNAFRITRNADVRRNEEEADDLIEMIADELQERRSAPVVRLEVDNDMPAHVQLLLMRELELEAVDVYRTTDGLVDHADCSFFANLNLPEHTFPRWEPHIPKRFLPGPPKAPTNIFEEIKKGDLLVHHPYESFRGTVQHFLEMAADDPQVLAIKQTLYRTSSDSPVAQALVRAAQAGKQVAVLVEVKARFDEENNIEWAQMLEKAGVHVTYGLVGLKTHTKVTLVIREEEGKVQTYCHIGTGNYNPTTARLYTDLGLFTADKERGYDVVNLFHYLTGYAPEQHYTGLLVAPRDMRDAFLQLIRDEVGHQKAHGTGRIVAQMNALDDVEVIKELYRASQAGVSIDLILRGHCRLRPGLAGFSDNIRVISILGRFLEHGRIYCFHNNGAPRVFIGSADWMRRNLEDRIEVATEIKDPAIRNRLIETLRAALNDRRSAWDLRADGHYILRTPGPGEEDSGYQDVMMRRVHVWNDSADPTA
ncbi:MAG: polyphosphate kinase 1 [Rhodothermales bacterium]|nr:polyphosphate kinase 1 [Rhodothermales bacterium]